MNNDNDTTIRFETDGRDFLLMTEQVIHRPLVEVFPFFADASNLERITPPELRFRILTAKPIEMRVGTVIDYRIALRGIPLRWRTLITKWSPPHEFEDSQVRGPYSKWVHTHTFRESGGATTMLDIVRYRPPLGPIGRIANSVIVERDLRSIFRFRRQQVREIFDPAGAASDRALQPALAE